ncbi:MAG: PilZ domain-containing protein [Deltaproteobacteria bacterium]
MDKREAVRVPVQVRARCRTDGLVRDGLVEDVSRSGLFLRIDPAELEPGADAEIDLDLPGEETLHLQVTVVRVEDQTRTGVALKFAGDSSTARMPLANFIMKSHQAR